MKIAVLSGKGGTGKTMVATNLAMLVEDCSYIDCDVEEPNGHLFLESEKQVHYDVSVKLPKFDANLCVGCRECVHLCAFHALIYIKNKPRVFEEVCHSCGGCSLVCKHHAISERPKSIGEVCVGQRGKLQIVTGKLNPGEATGIPIIHQALTFTKEVTLIDCPPGTACASMESMKEADYVLIVAEATQFGLANLKLVVELVQLFHKPCGVIINKYVENYLPLEDYLKAMDIPILMKIPYTQAYAKLGANGQCLVLYDEKLKQDFLQLLRQLGVKR